MNGNARTTHAGHDDAQTSTLTFRIARPSVPHAEAVMAPMGLLSELARGGWSGEVILSLAGDEVHVWMHAGRLAWAERSSQQRSLGQVLRELMGIDRTRMVQLAESWRARNLSLAEAVLAQPGMTAAKLRNALQEHLGEALSSVASSTPCRTRRIEQTAGRPYPTDWTFKLEEVVRPPVCGVPRRESIAELGRRVYGASWVDVVTDGSAGGVGPRSHAERSLLEAADELLLGHEDGVELAVLRGAFGTWAGLPTKQSSVRSNTWLAFDAEIGLGGAYLGLQAVCTRLDPLRALPSPPPLRSMPSLFPGADGGISYRAALTPALELAAGALAAYVVERDVVVWGSRSSAAAMKPAFADAVTRACCALELSPLDDAPAPSRDAAQLQSFVMLDGRDGFHVGTRVNGAARTFLVLTLAPGSSYGESIAALSLGAAALHAKLSAQR